MARIVHYIPCLQIWDMDPFKLVSCIRQCDSLRPENTGRSGEEGRQDTLIQKSTMYVVCISVIIIYQNSNHSCRVIYTTITEAL